MSDWISVVGIDHKPMMGCWKGRCSKVKHRTDSGVLQKKRIFSGSSARRNPEWKANLRMNKKAMAMVTTSVKMVKASDSACLGPLD